MPRKTMIALLDQADTTLPNNTAQQITAADVRQMIKDVIDSFAPGYGAMQNLLVTLAALGLTPRVVPYTSVLVATPEFTCVPASGTITRLGGGLPSTVNRVSFYADVAAPTGNEVVFSLFRDGVDIPGGTTVSAQGAGNVVQAAFSVGTTASDGLDHVYDIRASKISGGADDVELSNVRFIMEYVPTIGI